MENLNIDFITESINQNNEFKICIINDYPKALELRDEIRQRGLNNCVIYFPTPENDNEFLSDEIIKVVTNKNVFKLNNLTPYDYFNFIYCKDFFNVFNFQDELQNQEIHSFIFSKLKPEGVTLVSFHHADLIKVSQNFICKNIHNRDLITNLRGWFNFFDGNDGNDFKINLMKNIFIMCQKSKI